MATGKDSKRFMNSLKVDSGVTAAIFFSVKSVNSENNQSFLITGSSTNDSTDKGKSSTSGHFILWDIEKFKCLQNWNGHSKSISTMTIISFGNKDENGENIDNVIQEGKDGYLISGSKDGSIKIWKLKVNGSPKDLEFQFIDILSFDFSPHSHPVLSLFAFSTKFPPPNPSSSNTEAAASTESRYYFTSTSNEDKGFLWDIELLEKIKVTDTKEKEKDTKDKSVKCWKQAQLLEYSIIQNTPVISTREKEPITESVNKVGSSKRHLTIDVVHIPTSSPSSKKIYPEETSNNDQEEPSLKSIEIGAATDISKLDKNLSPINNIKEEDDNNNFDLSMLYNQNSENDNTTPNDIKDFCASPQTTENDFKTLEVKLKVKLTSIVVFVPKSKQDSCHYFNGPVIIAKCDKRVVLFDFTSGDRIENKQFDHSKDITALCIFNPSKKVVSSPIIVTGCRDGSIHIWDLKEMIKIKKLPIPLSNKASLSQEIVKDKKNVIMFEKGHSDAVTCVVAFDYSFDQNCPQIASCSLDKKIIIWDILSGHKIRTISGSHISNITFVSAMTNKDTNKMLLLSGGEESSNNIFLWDISASRTEKKSSSYTGNIEFVTIFDPAYDGNNNSSNSVTKNSPICILANGKRISIIDIETLEEIGDAEEKKKLSSINQYGEVIVSLAVTKDQNYSNNTDIYCILIAVCFGTNRLSTESPGGRFIVIRKIELRYPNNCYFKVQESETKIIKLEEKFSSRVLSMHFLYTRPYTYLIVGCANNKDYDQNKKNKAPIKFLSIDIIFKTAVVKNKDYINGQDVCISVFQKIDKSGSIAGEEPYHSNNIQCINSFVNSGHDKNINIVSGSDDETTIIWNLLIQGGNTIMDYNITINKISTLYHNNRVLSVAIYKKPNNKSVKTSVRYPLIISGCMDGQITIWDSDSCSKLHTIFKHINCVVSISLYTPSSSNPLFVTSSHDKVVIVWELNLKNVSESKLVRKLRGHTDQVNSVSIYTPTKTSQIPAIIITGGNDQKLIAWHNSLDLAQSMPTKSEVLDYFNSDSRLLENNYWPLMASANEEFGLGVWIENAADLFHSAIGDNRVDFFILFKEILKKVIRYTNRVEKGLPESLFQKALNDDNFYVIDIILDCWLENINKDIHDPLMQRLYHASYLLKKDDLIRLSHQQPSLFLKFISGVRLIKTDIMLNGQTKKMNINKKRSYVDTSSSIFVSHPDSSTSNMWEMETKQRNYDNYPVYNKLISFYRYLREKIKDSKTDKEKPIISKYLPIQYATQKYMLEAYVDVCISEQDVKIFDSAVGIVVVEYLWMKYAFWSHLRQSIVYLAYVCLYSYSVFRYELYYQNFGSKNPRYIGLVLNVIVICMTIYYFSLKCFQIYNDITDKENDDKKESIGYLSLMMRIIDHFYDVWNFNELLIISLVITASSLRLDSYIREGNAYVPPPSYSPTFQPSLQSTTYSMYPSSYPSVGATEKNVENSSIRCIYAVVTICVYFKILYYLRPFPEFGPLVSIIKRVARDILSFLFILLLMMCAFAQAYWILNGNSSNPNTAPTNYFGTSIWKSYLHTFMFMLGQGVDPAAFANAGSYPLNILMLAIFMILLMLNLLIAIMNDSYRMIREKGLAQWRLEQGGTILNDPWISKQLKQQPNPFIYILSYTSVTDLSPEDANDQQILKEKTTENYIKNSSSNVPVYVEENDY